MATVGHDFEPYRRWLQACNVSLDHVRELDDEFTAQAFITTDLDDNQITAFHPGAMSQSHLNAVPTDARRHARRRRTGRSRRHGRARRRSSPPREFRGCSTPARACRCSMARSCVAFIDKATWVAVNDYEGQMLQERTGSVPRQIAARVEAYIVTKGADGSVIHAGRHANTGSRRPRPDAVKDPDRLRRCLPRRAYFRPHE